MTKCEYNLQGICQVVDHVPSNALRVFYVGGYRVKQVPALSLSNVTNEGQICWEAAT